MEPPELLDAVVYLIDVVGITCPCVIDELGYLIAVIRVDVSQFVADIPAVYETVDQCFLTAVYHPVGTLFRDTHYVTFALAAEQERAVGHTVFQYGDISYIKFLNAKFLHDYGYGV